MRHASPVVFALLVGVGLGYVLATPQPTRPPPDPPPEFAEIVVEQPGQELVVLRVVQSHDGKEIRYVAPAGPEAWRERDARPPGHRRKM